MKPVLFGLLSLIFLAHCSQPDPAPPRALHCYVRYLEPEAQLRAEAIYREGDSLRPAELPGGIRFGGSSMEHIPVQGNMYLINRNTAYEPKHSFEWTFGENQRGAFEIEMPALRQFGFRDSVIKRSQPNQMRWDGPPLSPEETLVFIWEQPGGAAPIRMEVGTSGQLSLAEFPAAKLAELSPGAWTLYLVRRKSVRDTLAGMPVQGVIEYFTHSDTILVE